KFGLGYEVIRSFDNFDGWSFPRIPNLGGNVERLALHSGGVIIDYAYPSSLIYQKVFMRFQNLLFGIIGRTPSLPSHTSTNSGINSSSQKCSTCRIGCNPLRAKAAVAIGALLDCGIWGFVCFGIDPKKWR